MSDNYKLTKISEKHDRSPNSQLQLMWWQSAHIETVEEFGGESNSLIWVTDSVNALVGSCLSSYFSQQRSIDGVHHAVFWGQYCTVLEPLTIL